MSLLPERKASIDVGLVIVRPEPRSGALIATPKMERSPTCASSGASTVSACD